MADETKIGTDWQADELDAIVADYFEMLAADISGRPYIKSRHSAALMAQTRRTHRSVEFKHQNISAVLDELGMPWIPGYKPKRNYQNAIFDAIDRYLSKHPAALETVAVAPAPPISPAEIFVTPPSLVIAEEPVPAGLARLVRKFDPVERDLRNRTLGRAGEEFVLELERRRLTGTERSDLARKIRWIAGGRGMEQATISCRSTRPAESGCWRSRPRMDPRGPPFSLVATSARWRQNAPPTGGYIGFICSLRNPVFLRLRRRWRTPLSLQLRRGGRPLDDAGPGECAMGRFVASLPDRW